MLLAIRKFVNCVLAAGEIIVLIYNKEDSGSSITTGILTKSLLPDRRVYLTERVMTNIKVQSIASLQFNPKESEEILWSSWNYRLCLHVDMFATCKRGGCNYL